MNEQLEKILKEEREKNLREAGIDPTSEASLLKSIPVTKDIYRIKDIVQTLYVIGTKDSLLALEGLLSYPKEDVKICAFSTIVRILGAGGQDIYIDKLGDPKFRDKFGAVLAIRQYCDGRAVEAVTKRLKALLARERRAVYYSPEGLSELLAALDYLHSQGGEIRTNAHCLIGDKQQLLEPKEKEWIKVNFPGLLGHGSKDQGGSEEINAGQQDAGGKGSQRSWFASLWGR